MILSLKSIFFCLFFYSIVCKALGEITIDPIVIRKKHFFNSVTDEPVSSTQ